MIGEEGCQHMATWREMATMGRDGRKGGGDGDGEVELKVGVGSEAADGPRPSENGTMEQWNGATLPSH